MIVPLLVFLVFGLPLAFWLLLWFWLFFCGNEEEIEQ